MKVRRTLLHSDNRETLSNLKLKHYSHNSLVQVVSFTSTGSPPSLWDATHSFRNDY